MVATAYPIARRVPPRIFLAGVSGVGKTTVAMRIARDYGIAWQEAMSPLCINYVDRLERQKCFLAGYLFRLFKHADTMPTVYDNSALSVMAYSYAHAKFEGGGTDVLIRTAIAAQWVFEAIESNFPVIVLAVEDMETLRRRIEFRGEVDSHRTRDRYAVDMKLHELAQKELLEIASVYNLPIIYTDKKTPEEVAKEIDQIVNEYMETRA